MRRVSLIFSALCLAALSWAKEVSPATGKQNLTLQDLINSTTAYHARSKTAAGAGGLEEPTAEVDTKARDYDAIAKMEAIVTHPDELKTFMAEGKLK